MEAKNIQSKKANKHGWHNNTHLCVNLKTQLRSDRRAKSGKGYQGILRRDVECDECRRLHRSVIRTSTMASSSR